MEDTIHYFWNLCLIRFIQNEQILHGTVAGTDVYLADFFMNGLFQTCKGMFSVFRICDRSGRGVNCDHYKETVMFIALIEMVHVFIYFCKFPVIKVQGTIVTAAFAQSMGN